MVFPKNKTTSHLLAGCLAAALCAALPAAKSRGAAPVYRITRTVPLGAPDTWDYLAFDAASHLVVVAHGTEATLLDSESGQLLGRLGPIKGTAGVLIANGKVYATSRDPGSLIVFDLETLNQVAAIPMGKGPDGALYDPASHRGFIVDEEDRTVTTIDMDVDKALFTTDLDGTPEFLAAAAGKLYVNIKDRREVARMDIASGKLDARWSVPDCEAPHGMAIDTAGHRLFSSCTNGKMMVLDTDNGAVVASVPIGRKTDAAAYDPKHKQVFSSNGEGTLSVIAERSVDEFVSLGDIPTAPGARTMALDPDTGRIFLVTATVASARPAEDGGKSFRFNFVPGSLKMLILDPVR